MQNDGAAAGILLCFNIPRTSVHTPDVELEMDITANTDVGAVVV